MAEHEPCIGASDDWSAVRDALHYDPETGVFWWTRNRTNVKAGSAAGSRIAKGYMLIRFNRRQLLAHRLAWLWMTGEWPSLHIDHIDGEKSNNRWSNLREASNADNLMNRGKNSNNTSGYKGVSFDKKTGRYSAFLTADKKRRFLGYHATAEEAHNAYRAAIQIAAPVFGKA